jgi:hypothetical protein
MTTLYKKQGRRYVPVGEYTPEWDNNFPDGVHIVVTKPGISSRRYKINPAFAPLIAAGLYAEDAMARAISDASAAQPSKQPLSADEMAAWKHMEKVFGDKLMYISYPSAFDIAQAGIKAMQEEAAKKLKHPSVAYAWDQFMLTWQLCNTDQKE